jgi:hypothetical protein
VPGPGPVTDELALMPVMRPYPSRLAVPEPGWDELALMPVMRP